jgi:hypothetical protein
MSLARYLYALNVWALCMVALSACSPALNWRQVQLHALKATLPCKPDTATRQAPLGDAPLDLQMMGCEAEGALFAVSHVHAPSAAAAAQVIARWQAQALQALQATETKTEFWQAPPWAGGAVSLFARGRDPKGQAVQARLTWLSHGVDVYHFAVYAETLTDAMMQPLLEDLQAP